MTEIPKQDLLLKLLGMTTSSSDNEALVAIRQANRLLSASGWTWEILIREKIKIIENPFKGIADPRTAARPAEEEQRGQGNVPPKPFSPRPARPPEAWSFADGMAAGFGGMAGRPTVNPTSQQKPPQMGPQNAGPLPSKSRGRTRGPTYRPDAGEL